MLVVQAYAHAHKRESPAGGSDDGADADDEFPPVAAEASHDSFRFCNRRNLWQKTAPMPKHKQTDAADAAPDVLQQVAADVVTARAKARHSVFGIAPVVTYAALDIVDEEEEEYEEEKAALAGLASEAALPPLQSGAALHSVAAHTTVVTK